MLGHKSLARHGFSGERGVALLMVITVLVTLVIIAVAFAPQMQRGHERTEANGARARADFEARQLAQMVQLFLSGSHPKNELALRDKGENGVQADPRVDTLAEITPGAEFRDKVAEEIRVSWTQDAALAQKLSYLEGRGLSPLNDDRGSIWTVLVQDAQACVNVSGSSPFLIANLVGSALLSEDVDAGAPDIPVEHVAQGKLASLVGFPADGGLIRIGNEVISYEEFDGSSFRGCERGVLRDSPLLDNGSAASHEKRSAVIDYTAYKLATHLIASRPGYLTKFENFEDLKSIGTWGGDGTISAHRLAQLRPYLTLHSRRETAEGWLAPQLVVEQLPTSIDGDAQDVVKVRDVSNPTGTSTWFNAGTLVRVTDGQNTSYQMVATVGDPDGRLVDDREFTLAGRVDAGRGPEAPDLIYVGGQTMVAALAPFPININTAPVEVLYAVMVNLHHRFAKEDDQIVTPSVAWTLAEDIVRSREGKFSTVPGTEDGEKWRQSGPFRNAEDFGRFLKERVNTQQLTRAQEFALYTNAINPHANSLKFGTTTWCFRTMDVYHVEARVAVNNRGGEQIAATTIREVVEIGADEITAWTVDSQADFEERVQQGSGAKWTATYPFAITFINNGQQHVQPRQRAPKHIVRGLYPSTSEVDPGSSADVGDVRLEPVRMQLPGAVVAEHFDWSTYQDGHYTPYDGAYKRKVRGAFRGDQQTYVQPFSMSFWWRSRSDGSSWTAFDCGMDKFINRYAIFVTEVEGERQLVFRACAGTLERRGAEVFVPLERLDYRPDIWYHIHVSCAGEDPSTMELLIDGLDLSERRGLTYLEGSLNDTDDSTEVTVESTLGFPPQGAIQIGTEIIEYDLLDRTSFRECQRGFTVRGTSAQAWPSGTPVRLLGYSLPLLVDVMTGGAYLDDELEKWSAVRVTGDGFDDEMKDATGFITLRGYSGVNSAPQNVVIDKLWEDADDVERAAAAFGPKGLALFGSWRHGGDFAEQAGGWEMVYYTRTGTSFQIERYWDESKWFEAPAPYFIINHRMIQAPGVSIDEDFPCFLVPISVAAQGGGSVAGDDYLDPNDGTHEPILRAYGGDGLGRVLLGTDDPVDQYEVIQYDTIERRKAAPHILFVRDRNATQVGNYFFNDSQDAPPLPPPDDDDPIDPLPDPEPPEGPDPDDPTDVPQDTPPTPEPPPPEGEEQPPTPGGSVPPGMRDPPTDDPGTDPDPTPDPSPDPGDTPTPAPEPGVGDDPDVGSDPVPQPGTGDDGEPVEPVEPSDDGGFSPGGGSVEPSGDGDEGGSSGGGGASDGGSPGGGSDAGGSDGGGDTATPKPEEVEPPPDTSGEGENEAEEADPQPVGQVPSDLRDPESDEVPINDDPALGGSTMWDPLTWGNRLPVGPLTALNVIRFRGVLDTVPRRHTRGGGRDDRNARFMPCFRVWEQHSGPRNHRVGRNDPITIVAGGDGDAAPERVEAQVRWGHHQSDWMCLEDFIDQRVMAPAEGADVQRLDLRGRPRILKFPCGELPDEMSEDMEFGQSTIANSDVVSAYLDELYIWRHPMGPLAIAVDSEGVEATASEITVYPQGPNETLEDTPGWDPDCGVFLLNGEMIVYRGTYTEGDGRMVLERCARGMFKTKARFHAPGSYGRFLPDIAVSALDGNLTKDSASIPLVHTRLWPREGLVRILGQESGELVHFTRRTERDLMLPEALDAYDEYARGTGILRGRFGTDAVEHDSDSIVIFTPFRYWDRYTPRKTEEDEAFSGVHDHAESAYVELGLKRDNAYWHSLRWEENLDGVRHAEDLIEERRGSTAESGFLDIIILARFSSNVPWDSDDVIDMRESASVASTRRGHSTNALYIFDEPDAMNDLGFEANTAEVRVYFEYKPNAYQFLDLPGESGDAFDDDVVLVNEWKKTPWLQSLSISYTNRTRTLTSAKAGHGK